MIHLHIDYSTFVAVLAANPTWSRYKVVRGDAYFVFTGHEEIIFESYAADQAAFDAAYPGTPEAPGKEDAVALLIGISVPPPQRDDLGHLVQTPTAYAHADEDGIYHGVPDVWEALPGAKTHWDRLVTTTVYVQGGMVWGQNPHLGDSIDFSIVDKDDSLGLFATYGLTVGADVLEIAKYVKALRPPPWDFHIDMAMPTAGRVLPGLYMRVSYDNVGADSTHVGVTYREFDG